MRHCLLALALVTRGYACAVGQYAYCCAPLVRTVVHIIHSYLLLIHYVHDCVVASGMRLAAYLLAQSMCRAYSDRLYVLNL